MKLHNNKHNNINKQRSTLTTKNNSQERHGALIKFCDRSHSQQDDDRVFHVSRRFLPRTLATISSRFPVISFRFSNFFFSLLLFPCDSFLYFLLFFLLAYSFIYIFILLFVFPITWFHIMCLFLFIFSIRFLLLFPVLFASPYH